MSTRLLLVIGERSLAVSIRLGGEEAESFFRDALRVLERTGTRGSNDVAAALTSLAAIRQTLGSAGEAEQLYRRASALKERAAGPCHACSRQGTHTCQFFDQPVDMTGATTESSTHAEARESFDDGAS
jgi:hypothetical protein